MSLEMPLINCKVELSFRWIENCVLTSAAVDANVNNTDGNSATFKITDAKLCPNCYFISRRQCKVIKIIRQRI